MRSFRTSRQVQLWKPHGQRLVFSILTTLVFSTATADAQVPFIRIAKTGDPAPGEPGNTYSLVSIGGIDDLGNVGVHGTVDGPGISGPNSERIWWGSPFDQQAVFVEGPAPQYGDDAEFHTIVGEQFSGTGQLAFTVRISGTGITDDNRVLFAGEPVTPQPTLRRGTVPPGITDGLILNQISPKVSPTDFLAVSGSLYRDDSSGNIAAGIWAGLPGNVSLVARSGANAPGTDVSFTSSVVLAPNFTVNRRGAIAFPANLEGPGVDETNNAGIWAGDASDLALLSRAGDPAPGTGPGVKFIGRPQYGFINANDRVIFPSFLTGPGVDSTNNLGVWMGRVGEAPQLVARNGDPVPLLGDDYTTTDFFPFFLTDQDRIVILLEFTGPGVTPEDNEAIFFGGLGDFHIVLREGEQAPGLPAGIRFDFDVDTPEIVIKDSGAMALEVSLAGPGINESNDRALYWQRTSNAPLALVAREGNLFDGGIIADDGIFLFAGTGASGGGQAMNERGDLVFLIGFIDGKDISTGVYLCSRAARISTAASPIRLRGLE